MATLAKRFPTRYLVPLVDQLRRQGVDAIQLMRTAGLDGAGFEGRDATLNPAQLESLAQVALRLGFSDAANFSRAFRRVFGVAPGEYQKRGTSRPPTAS